MADQIVKTSEIKVNINMNENHLPVEMDWKASDTDDGGECKAVMLNLWDKNELNTLGIHLWIKDMPLNEMKLFFHQTLLSMSDTFERASGEHEICEDLRDYCMHFAKHMGIVLPDSKEN